MGYIQIVDIVMTICHCIIMIFIMPYIFSIIVGTFCKRRRFPEREEKLKYGVIICACNEENVIADLIDSIRKSDYPQDKIDVFVIAHNCTDTTAEVARRAAGGTSIVWEYSNDKERTKGYALKKIFELIKEEYGTENYDGFHVFDADNILDKKYLSKMNDAFLFYDRKYAINSFRNSKNFGENIQTAMYGISYTLNCTMEFNGKDAMHISSRNLGSGFLLTPENVKNGWEIVNLSDDTDFTIDQVLQGNKVMYCDEAMYYDEHPTTFKAMWKQRLRWAKGNDIVMRKRFKSLFTSLFKRKKKRDASKLSAFDLMTVILPVGIFGIINVIVDITLRSLAPLFGCDPLVVWRNWGIWFAVGTAIGIIFLYIQCIFVYIKEKRIKGVSVKTKILSTLCFPFFAVLLIPLQIVAVFKRKFTWTVTKHKSTANFETFNGKSEKPVVAKVEGYDTSKNKMMAEENQDIQNNQVVIETVDETVGQIK